MNAYDAVQIAEGNEEASDERIVEAWQVLVDTGMAWTLQGWFGRRAAELIDLGVVQINRKDLSDVDIWG